MDHLCFLRLVFLMLSRHCCLVVTCCERADLLTLVDDVYCISVIFPCGILGRVWYLIVSFPGLCRLSYLKGPRTVSYSICPIFESLWLG